MGDAADMVQFLGPTPLVEAILDKLDSLYSSVSTFDIMMQGFYRGVSREEHVCSSPYCEVKGKIEWNPS